MVCFLNAIRETLCFLNAMRNGAFLNAKRGSFFNAVCTCAYVFCLKVPIIKQLIIYDKLQAADSARIHETVIHRFF